MKKRKKAKKFLPLPPVAQLHELFEYDFETGELTWKKTGKVAGWLDSSGYRSVAIGKIKYKVHRLIYFMFHRVDPGKKVIDHIDGDKINNRLINLRCVKRSVNSKNTAYQRKRGIVPKPEKAALYFT